MTDVRPYRILFLTLLCTVYTAFFSVQFFFNFEAFSGNGVFAKYSSVTGSATKGKTTLAKKNTGHPSGTSFRLNKRFQQEDMPPCEGVSVVIPEQYLPVKTSESYSDPLLPSRTPTGIFRRGPPFTA